MLSHKGPTSIRHGQGHAIIQCCARDWGPEGTWFTLKGHCYLLCYWCLPPRATSSVLSNQEGTLTLCNSQSLRFQDRKMATSQLRVVTAAGRYSTLVLRASQISVLNLTGNPFPTAVSHPGRLAGYSCWVSSRQRRASPSSLDEDRVLTTLPGCASRLLLRKGQERVHHAM